MGGMFSKLRGTRKSEESSSGAGSSGGSGGLSSKAAMSCKGGASEDVSSVPQNLEEVLSRKHKSVWEPRFRQHLTDLDNRAKVDKLKWRVDLLDFCLLLHDLKHALKTELKAREGRKVKKAAAAAGRPQRSASTSSSSSSSSSSDDGGGNASKDPTRLEHNRREICERLHSQFLANSAPKKVPVSDASVRNRFQRLVREQSDNLCVTSSPSKPSGASGASAASKSKTRFEYDFNHDLYETINEVHADRNVWTRISKLCDEFLTKKLQEINDLSSVKKAAQAVLLSIL